MAGKRGLSRYLCLLEEAHSGAKASRVAAPNTRLRRPRHFCIRSGSSHPAACRRRAAPAGASPAGRLTPGCPTDACAPAQGVDGAQFLAMNTVSTVFAAITSCPCSGAWPSHPQDSRGHPARAGRETIANSTTSAHTAAARFRESAVSGAVGPCRPASRARSFLSDAPDLRDRNPWRLRFSSESGAVRNRRPGCDPPFSAAAPAGIEQFALPRAGATDHAGDTGVSASAAAMVARVCSGDVEAGLDCPPVGRAVQADPSRARQPDRQIAPVRRPAPAISVFDSQVQRVALGFSAAPVRDQPLA